MEIFSTTNSASSLIASVSTAVQTTFGSLFPILAVVAGLILSFIVARWVISLFRHAGRTSGR